MATNDILSHDPSLKRLRVPASGNNYRAPRTIVASPEGSDPSLVIEKGDIILPKASGYSLMLDDSDPTYMWKDLIGLIQPKATGAGSPTRRAYAGGVLSDYSFALNDMCDLNFHIPHDYLPGSDMFIHVHWSHTGTSISGNLDFEFYHSYSKGHNQAAFPSEKNVTLQHSTVNVTTTPRYRHFINEVQLSVSGGSASQIDSDDIEVDGLIMSTLKLTGMPTIGGGGFLFVHTADIHYQSTGLLGTKNKAPNFYT